MREISFRAWDKHTLSWLDKCTSAEMLVMSSYGTSEQIMLMQFTGLLDKNGVEIYEGDIVKFSSFGGHYPIEYKKCSFYPDQIARNECEIIGNIYENPELLAPKE